MALSPAPADRAAARLRFARHACGQPQATLLSASEDASARSYWRLATAGQSAIVMDAPPGSGDLGAWLDVDARLRAAGLNAPKVLAADRAQGFLLLSDLGSRTYLSELQAGDADALYADALEALLTMQTRVATADLPEYTAALLSRELELMPEWFLARHLGAVPTGAGRRVLDDAFAFLVDAACAQPRVFVHRDFHSRNLLVVPGHNPGIVDLQDAVLGPVTYDLASLLRDCYIAWDDERVRGWAERHRRRLAAAGALEAGVDAALWRRWFDLVGLQRHLKVLGIFCRLWYRDGKPGYLGDLPRVWAYVRSVAGTYPELHGLLRMLEAHATARDLTRAAA